MLDNLYDDQDESVIQTPKMYINLHNGGAAGGTPRLYERKEMKMFAGFSNSNDRKPEEP